MEENKIQEAEVTPVQTEEKKEEGYVEASIESSTEEEAKPKRRNDFYIELALFLILGFLIGVAVKTEAAKRITIGFNDYKMKIFSGGYDINKLQIEQTAKMAEEERKQQENQDSGNIDQPKDIEGGNCSAQ